MRLVGCAKKFSGDPPAKKLESCGRFLAEDGESAEEQ